MSCRIFEASHHCAEWGCRKPLRHGSPKHSLALGTLACNNEHVTLAAFKSSPNEREEKHIRLILRKTVQVDPPGDFQPALRKLVAGWFIELSYRLLNLLWHR